MLIWESLRTQDLGIAKALRTLDIQKVVHPEISKCRNAEIVRYEASEMSIQGLGNHQFSELLKSDEFEHIAKSTGHVIKKSNNSATQTPRYSEMLEI